MRFFDAFLDRRVPLQVLRVRAIGASVSLVLAFVAALLWIAWGADLSLTVLAPLVLLGLLVQQAAVSDYRRARLEQRIAALEQAKGA